MKKETLFVVALAGVLAYLYFMKKDKKQDVVKPADINPQPKPSIPKLATNPVVKSPVTVDDLSKKPVPADKYAYTEVMDIKRPEIKEPVVIEPINLIPNIYDRGVGAKLNINPDQMYASFSGQCSENIQTACRCVKSKDSRYKLDIPQLP